MKHFNPRDYGAAGDGIHLDTEAIQKAIDAAGAAKGTVVLTPGTYLVSSLFLGSHMEFHLEEGAKLLGTTEESQYPVMSTRVAGIEMDWYVGILNINGQSDVKVSGGGIIDGQGPYWWEKYWGTDRKGGMRSTYDARGLRWCVDYDCRRVRNLVVMNSEDIALSGFEAVRSGFWNIHICYCQNVTVDGLYVHDNAGPSTDGIDIDSCRHVEIKNCRIACNDDCICVKSGRDADGLRVNRVCEDVWIHDCDILTGSGVTLGSETSGGIRKVLIENVHFRGTSCGFRIKSARTRGGLIEDIQVRNLDMINVKRPFQMDLDWNPAYSYCTLPADHSGEIPAHWHTLLKRVSPEQGRPHCRKIAIENITASVEGNYNGISRAFEISAPEENPLENISFNHIRIQAREFGTLAGIKNWKWNDIIISTGAGS